jgi:transposase-like protein
MTKTAAKPKRQAVELLVVRRPLLCCPLCGGAHLRTRSSRRNGLGDRIARVECGTCGRAFRLEETVE